jgi:hypothetical protein
MKRPLIKILLHVVLPLLIGFLIYFFFRPGYWFVELFGKREPITDLTGLDTYQQVLIFSLPDACWSYSFCSTLFIWGNWAGFEKKYFPFLIFLLVILSELIQLFIKSTFTFDWPDLVAAIGGFGLSYFLVYRYEKT